MRPGWALTLLFAAALAAPAQNPTHRIEALLAASGTSQRAFWGIQALDLQRNEILFEHNPHQFFLPASNTKLFTTALALVRLGPDYRFHTRVVAENAPDSEGRIRGDVHLAGGGDPTLSNRAYPYVKGPKTGDPLEPIDELARQVIAGGVRRIEGDIVGDDTAYVWEPYPDGWALDDALWEYGAPVSALTVNDNVVGLRLRGEREGEPPSITLSPPLDYYVIDNRVRVARQGGVVRLERLPGSRFLRLWGALAPGQTEDFSLAIQDPALYAAQAFADALRRRGVVITGRATARHRFANYGYAAQSREEGVVLARRVSPPLVEILKVIDKVSQNLHAELVLREVGRVCRNHGSREAGLEELSAFLSEVGIPRTEYRFLDGSGLSRQNLVTPAAIVRLLAYMHRSPHRDAWVALLPIGAEDGTLSGRFIGAPGAARIRAKTGTLARASALAGYAESSHGPVAFAVLANNYLAPASEIRSLIDKIVLLLAE